MNLLTFDLPNGDEFKLAVEWWNNAGARCVSAIELGKSGGRPETLAAIKKALEKAGVECRQWQAPRGCDKRHGVEIEPDGIRLKPKKRVR